MNVSDDLNRTLFITSIHNPELEDYRLGYVVTSIIMSIIMTLGNGIVLLLFYQERHHLKVAHKFITSMAMCDFLTGCIFMPIMVYKFEAKVACDSPACPYIISILIAIYQTSLFVVSASTIDRFWAVVFPVNYRTRMTSRIANTIIIVSWVIPWVLGSMHLVTYEIPAYKDLVCVISRRIIAASLIYPLMFSMVLNLTVIIFLYVFIHLAIVKAFRANHRSDGFFKESYKIIVRPKSDKLRPDYDPKSPLKAREIRSTLLVLMVVVCAVITMVPVTLHVMIISLNPKLFRIQDRLIIYVVMTVNALIDPIIYAFNIKNIRQAARKLFYRMILCVEVKQDGSSSMTVSTVN